MLEDLETFGELESSQIALIGELIAKISGHYEIH